MLPFDNKKAAGLIVARMSGGAGHEQKAEDGIDSSSQEQIDLGSDLLAAIKGGSPSDLYAAIEAIVHHCMDAGDDDGDGQ